MFGFLLHNTNMAPLVNFTLTSAALTEINTKSLDKFISFWARKVSREILRINVPKSLYAQLLIQVMRSASCLFFFYCSERISNYWASGTVKCAAVVTVSARWAIELVCKMTVGGV